MGNLQHRLTWDRLMPHVIQLLVIVVAVVCCPDRFQEGLVALEVKALLANSLVVSPFEGSPRV